MGFFIRFKKSAADSDLSQLIKENKRLLRKVRSDFKGYALVRAHYKAAVQDVQEIKNKLGSVNMTSKYIQLSNANLSQNDVSQALFAVKEEQRKILSEGPHSEGNQAKLSNLLNLELGLNDLKTSMKNKDTLLLKGSSILQVMKDDKSTFKQRNEMIEGLGGEPIPFKENSSKASATAKKSRPS